MTTNNSISSEPAWDELFRNKGKAYIAWQSLTRLQRLVVLYDHKCQNCGITTSFDDKTEVGTNFDPETKRYIPQYTLGGNYPTVEHIKPRSAGGNNHPSNITLYCNDCNFNMGKLYEYYNGLKRGRSWTFGPSSASMTVLRHPDNIVMTQKGAMQ